MNKNQFRIIFNSARGIMMAVAENVTSHASSTNASSTCKATKTSTGDQTAIIRPLAFSILLALGMVGVLPNTFSVNTAHADIIADTAAASNQRPMVINAANGVPLVNIQTPSAAGVSRNTYSQFDVSQQGVILNNSRTNVQTQLGGFVQGNPYLAAGTARIILNEVNSSNPSLLNGYVEVAGSRAQVIIANPAGISCSGCGFINASVATLTTGTPMIHNGDLTGYRVGGGVIAFLGAGLDASQTDYTNVLARAVSVNAGIWANNLNITTGSNQVNVASNGTVTGIGAITPDAGDATPAFAVDVAALGGMYAGKIHLIGTEAGLGVRNAGDMAASAGEVTIDVNGNLTNSKRIAASSHTTIQANRITNTGATISAGQQLAINAASLTGDGSVLAGADANITLTSDYTHTSAAALQAGGNLTLTTTGNIDNQAKLLAGNTLTLNAANINNSAKAEIAGADTHINTTQGDVGRLGTGTLTNRGLIDGSDTFIAANTINNIGTGSIFGDHIAIAANTLNNRNETLLVNGLSNTTAAIIAARTRLDIGAGNISNVNGSLLFSAGDMAIGGSVDANHQATVSASQIPVQGNAQAATLINQGATIEALGNLSANVADLQNLNAGITTQTTLIGSTVYDQFTPRGTSVILDAADYPGAQIGNVRVSTRSAGPYSFREYYRYLYTGNTSETQVLTSAPAQLLSGGNMTLLGNIDNSDSKIIAGGALDVTGARINNLNSQGQTTTSYNGTLYYYDYDGSGKGFRYKISASTYNPADNVTSFNLATTQYQANTSPASVGAASNTTVATLNNNTLPANSLFTPTANAAAGYLIETNPRFANYKTWLSSDYMLAQLSYDPATQTKRLGDGFYEQRLIREQVNQLTGQRFLAGYSSDEAQYQALMVNGVTFAKAFNLTPGIALSDLQMAQLTSDIVWLVSKEVTLPNGTVTKALVPQVYAKLRDGDLQNTGALLAGKSVQLNLTGDATNSGSLVNAGNLFNSGTIGSRTLLALNANNIHNLGGRISANALALDAMQDINNIGGTITAQNSLQLKAGRDINVQSTTQSSANQTGASAFTRTNLDRVAGLYVTNPSGAGILVASAGNNINLNAADIRNDSQNDSNNANSQTALKAGNNINLSTVQIAEQNNSVQNAKNYLKHGSTQEIGSSITTQGDMTLQAGNDINARAANIASENGALQGIAGNAITIEAGQATSNMSAARYKKKSGTFSSKKTTTRDTFNDTNSIGSNLSAETIDLVAGAVVDEDGKVTLQPSQGTLPSPVILSAAKNPVLGNIAITGSNVVATNDVNLNASGNVNITASQDTHDETHFKQVKQSGLSSSGASVTYGKSSLKTTNDTQTTTNVASTVGSVGGDVNINAGLAGNTGIYTQTASDVLTPAGNINITAQQVNIVAGQDTYANQQTMKYKQSGLTLAVSNPVLSAIQTTSQMANAAKQTDDPRMQALAAATSALSVNNALNALPDQYGNVATAGNTGPEDMTNLREANAVEQIGGINVSISIGSSKSKSSTAQTSMTTASSHLIAGGDVKVTAIGVGTASNINVIGSQIKANDDVNLNADGAINLMAAQNVDTLNSKNSGSSASLGVSFGTDGFLVTASASASKGKARGNGTTWTETQIQSGHQAGDVITLQSATDTNLIGAQVMGNQVIADIGTSGTGNLNIQSLQDTNDYKRKQQSLGGSISVGAGTGGGSINMSSSKTKSNYASVNEQSGIMAGNGGFQVNVAGNTNLTGSVVTSSEQAIQYNKNSLTTETLTSSDIENKAKYSAKGINLGVGVNVGLTENNKPVAGVTKSVGWGSLSDDAKSVTISGVSDGKIFITDNTANVANLNRDVKTQLETDAQGNISAIGIDSKGNNLAHTINPIFNAEKVQQELDAQMQITQAFDKAQQQFRLEINRKVDKAKAEKETIADMLKNQDLNEDQRLALINQGLNAQKEIEQLENMGLVFSAVAGGLSAPTNSIGGIMANSLAPEMANQIGQYFKDHGTEGSAPHILAHGVLAGAVAALGGNNPMGAALSAMGGEIAAPLVADLLYGKASDELNAEQKATVSAIASLSGVAASTSVSGNVNNIAQANLAAQNAVDNNWGEVGHYSTMATVLYLAGFSVKDAKAIALAAWAPDTDGRNAVTIPNFKNGKDPSQPQIANHGLNGEKDPKKVIADQQELAKQVGKILSVMKQFEKDPATKALYLSQPVVQQILHLFGDSFAHVQKDGTRYDPNFGHIFDSKTGNDPDNPNSNSKAYKNYVNILFNLASQTTVAPRVGNSVITNLADKVTRSPGEFVQQLILYDAIGSVSKSEATNLVRSPVKECGLLKNCQEIGVGSYSNQVIWQIYNNPKLPKKIN